MDMIRPLILCVICLCSTGSVYAHKQADHRGSTQSNYNSSHRAWCRMCQHNYEHDYGTLRWDPATGRHWYADVKQPVARFTKVAPKAKQQVIIGKLKEENAWGEYCTPDEVRKIVATCHPTTTDVCYELGCGDGRICEALSSFGCTIVGIEIDPKRVQLARKRVARLPKERRDRITIIQGDITTAGLIESQATVVNVHQMPSLLADIALRLHNASKLKTVCSIAHPLSMRQQGEIVDYWWAPFRVPHMSRRFFIYRR